MILTCPSCLARFMISSESLGSTGRDVRCGKCAHMWFQAAEKDSIDELPANGFDPWNEAGPLPDETIVHEDIEIDLKDKPKPKVTPQKAKPVKKEKPRKVYSAKFRNIAAVVVALIISMSFSAAFFILKDTLGKDGAFFERAYTKLGLAPKAEQAKLSFDRLKLSRSGATITGTGYIINLTSENVPVELVKIYLEDLNGKALQATDIKINGGIKAEGQQKVDFVFNKIPHEAVDIRAVIER